jgi:hypothetical protein
MTRNERLWLPLAAIALAKLALHFVTNALGGYGYFRDELYYLASIHHLSWGYVDHPPLSIALLALQTSLFGSSIFALRLFPALAGALTLVVIMLLARELGGGRWAMALAGAAGLVSHIVLAFDTIYSMNAYDLVIWATAGLLLARLVNHERPRDWLLLGLLLGVGLENKVGVLWLAAGLFVAIVATPLRRSLRSRWPWLAAALALILFAPYVLWNLQHDMAHAEFIANAVAGKYSGLGVADLLGGQLLINNPVNLPLWLGGLYFVLFGRGRRYRALGITFLSVVAVLLANGSSKPEYLAGAMSLLFAAGGVAFESWFEDSRRWVRPALLAATLGGLVMAPITLPILPVETYITFAATVGIKPHTSEAKELADLPQFYADMFGWPEKAEAVARAYDSLSAEDRAKVVIFASNYGRAGAIDFFGPALGLPGAISSHNSYWIWGPGERDGSVVLILGADRADLEERFAEVEEVGRVTCHYCMPYESDLAIYLCRGAYAGIEEIWPQIRSFG